MLKVGALILAVAMAWVVSGCAIIGRTTEPTETGKKVTIGLFSFDAVSGGSPMIPLYSRYEDK